LDKSFPIKKQESLIASSRQTHAFITDLALKEVHIIVAMWLY